MTMDSKRTKERPSNDHNTAGQGSSSLSLLVAAAGSRGNERDDNKGKSQQIGSTSSSIPSLYSGTMGHSKFVVPTSSKTTGCNDSKSTRDHSNAGDDAVGAVGIVVGDTGQTSKPASFSAMLPAASATQKKDTEQAGERNDYKLKSPPTYSDAPNDAKPPPQVAQRPEAGKTQPNPPQTKYKQGETPRSHSGVDSEADAAAKKSLSDSRRAKAVMIKTARSLSKDPLVQLSMLRAMQQQKVPADQVENIKLEREKALLKQRAAAKKKAHSTPKPQKVGKPSTGDLPHPLRGGLKETAPKASGASAHFRSASQEKPRKAPEGPKPALHPADSSVSLNSQHQTVQSQGQFSPDQLLLALQSMQQQLQQQNQPQQSQNLNQMLHSASFTQNQQVPSTGVENLDSRHQNLLSEPLSSILLQYALSNMNAQQQSPTQGIDLLRLLSQLNSQGGVLGDNSGHNLNTTTGAQASTSESASNVPLSNSYESDRTPHNEVFEAQSSGKETQETPVKAFDLRIPCRARGMPVDHNFQTAHFLIPQGAKHGEDLVCSYPACRDSGVKFRYCLYCRVPVARRNFRLRHNHKEQSAAALHPLENVNVPDTICVESKVSEPNPQARPNAPSARNVVNPAVAAAPEEQNLPGGSNLISLASAGKNAKKRHASDRLPKKKHKYANIPVPSEMDAREPGDYVPLTIQISSGNATPVNEHGSLDKEARVFKDDRDNAGDDRRRSQNADSRKDQEAYASEKKHRKSSKERKHSKRKHGDDGPMTKNKRLKAAPAANYGADSPGVAAAIPKPSKEKKKSKSRDKSSTNLVEDSQSNCKAPPAIRKRDQPVSEAREKESKEKKFSNKRLLVWADLLGKRPPINEDEHMSRWLMNVMAVSDLQIPLKGEGEGSSSPSSLTPDELGSDDQTV